MNNPMSSSSNDIEKVKVIVRCRPMSSVEIEKGYESIVQAHLDKREIEVRQSTTSDSSSNCTLFSYDSVYDSRVSQKELYENSFRPLVQSVLEGYNGTIFAYGQTATGKTFTMEGNMTNEEEYGIIPNAFKHIFSHVQENHSKQYLIRASYLEIYQEEITDLLTRTTNLKLKECPETGVYVKDLTAYLCSIPKYLGVYLDRSLTFKRNMESIRTKLRSRINVVQKLTGTTWGCSAKTLRITTKAMILSIADYCSSVWMSSVHVKLIDTQINIALRIITGTVHSTPIPWIYVLSNIAPTSFQREQSAIRECVKIRENSSLPINADMESAPIALRLKSRKPFWIFYRTFDMMENLKTRWKQWWNESNVTNRDLIVDPTVEVSGAELPRKVWCRLNRIRSGHGCCAYMMHKWKIATSPLCECGEPQTIEHLVRHCRIHRFEGSLYELSNISDRAINWLKNLAINI